MIYTAIMGYGTIGSGVAEILEVNKNIITKKTGQEIALKYVLDLRDFPDSPVADKIVHDVQILLQDPEVKIVVEAMGGLNPAYPFAKACLEAGKHVVTSNKALVAAHGTELLEIARKKQVNFLFEASVGGGIPVIRPMYRCLMGEEIQEITGILNGTTNYILTRMNKEGASFGDALKEAQKLGYAEQNPEADVEGHDTCRKIAILTAMATGKEVCYEDIYTEGITKITDTDFRYAEQMGTSIKLFGSSCIEDDTVHAWVAPVMIGTNHPLHTVSDVYNGILIKGNMIGTTMSYGSGAGKLPTASAVVADMMEAAVNLNQNIPIGWTEEVLPITPMGDSVHAYFVRIKGDETRKREQISRVFGTVETVKLEGIDEFAIVTGKMKEAEFIEKAQQLDQQCQAAGEAGILQMIRAQL